MKFEELYTDAQEKVDLIASVAVAKNITNDVEALKAISALVSIN